MFKGMTNSKSNYPPVSPFKSKKKLQTEPSSERKRKTGEINEENQSPNVDIEDIFDSGVKVKKSTFPTVHFKPNSPITPSTITAAITTTPPIAVEVDAEPISTVTNAVELQAWLKSRKSFWRKLRKERRMGEDEHATKRNTGGVMDFVRNASIDLKQKSWQIVELQQTETHGEFIVWAMTSKIKFKRLPS